jgi:hypothetical protein
MSDGQEGNLIPLAQHHGRQIAVQMIEMGQAQKGLAANDFKTAAGIERPIVE